MNDLSVMIKENNEFRDFMMNMHLSVGMSLAYGSKVKEDTLFKRHFVIGAKSKNTLIKKTCSNMLSCSKYPPTLLALVSLKNMMETFKQVDQENNKSLITQINLQIAQYQNLVLAEKAS